VLFFLLLLPYPLKKLVQKENQITELIQEMKQLKREKTHA